MTLALMFALGFVLGALLPRDVHPMRQLSAFFMRNQRNDVLAVGTVLLALAVCALALLFAGCAPRQESALSTGQTVSRTALPTALGFGHFAGDAEYAVVNSNALPAIYADFRSTLSGLGLVKWDERFDCNRFATLYIGVAQAKYAVAAWHSATKAQALALAEVWYLIGGDPARAHAIVLAITERGPVFIEPQTGKELSLTPKEQRTVMLAKW